MKMDRPTDESLVKDVLSGHCSFGPRDLDKHECPEYRQRFYFGPVRKEGQRKRVEGIIYLDEWYKCTCLCHIPEDERPKPRRTRKKAAPKTRRKK